MNELLKNIEKATALNFAELVAYEEGKVVSLTLAQQPGVAMTLFAFDAGEGIGGHSAPGDALVINLDGDAEITIEGIVHPLAKGQAIVMPKGCPHAVKALTRFKMLLTVVK